MKFLITGAAGFIGFHTCSQLLKQGHEILGVDNLNDYYEVSLKKSRLNLLKADPKFTFFKLDISNYSKLQKEFSQHYDVEYIIHLAAQAGVRHSLKDPFIYENSNLKGLLNILELVKKFKKLRHFIFASSSSVYGGIRELPYNTDQFTDRPISFYAATKMSGELMCHCYSHLYNIPITCLRFFTVYGPWGRPDMAAFSFTKKILEGETIRVFNNGEMVRDFTYIDDIVNGVVACTFEPPEPNKMAVPFSVYNIGNNNGENLMEFIKIIEKELGKDAIIDFVPQQPGEVLETCADSSSAERAFGFSSKIDISEGIPLFIEWYREYYDV